jgi:hypothetical protein
MMLHYSQLILCESARLSATAPDWLSGLSLYLPVLPQSSQRTGVKGPINNHGIRSIRLMKSNVVSINFRPCSMWVQAPLVGRFPRITGTRCRLFFLLTPNEEYAHWFDYRNDSEGLLNGVWRAQYLHKLISARLCPFSYIQSMQTRDELLFRKFPCPSECPRTNVPANLYYCVRLPDTSPVLYDRRGSLALW